MCISSSCAVPTPPTNVLAVAGCNSAEVTLGGLHVHVRNHTELRTVWCISCHGGSTIHLLIQWMNGGAPMTRYTSSRNFNLQNLQPNAMYAVSVAGINSCGGTSEFASTTFQLQGNFKFMDCHVTVYYCPYTHTNCVTSLLKASLLHFLWFRRPTYVNYIRLQRSGSYVNAIDTRWNGGSSSPLTRLFSWLRRSWLHYAM